MKKTRIYTANDLETPTVQTDIKNTVLAGETIIFPTETVYGIGAYALSEEGVKNIYKVKGRPSDNPLIIHLANIKDLSAYVYIDQPYVKNLMKAFWPGPLTMVFRRKSNVPDLITGGLNTVGVRIPLHPVAKKVLAIADVPICAPSANISGRPSSTLFEHVLEDFKDKVDIIVNGGKSDVGLESTVLDVTNAHPVILRPGVITQSMIENVTLTPVKVSSEAIKDLTPQAPGMKYKHYAPRALLTVVEGKESSVIDYINAQIKSHQAKNHKVGVVATEETMRHFTTPHTFNIGKKDNESTIASNLFIALRQMDQWQVDYIYSLSFHQTKYQEAIMNRLYKAANNQVIKL